MLLTPRGYQRDAIDRVRQVWDLGVRNAMVVAATGLGKTVIFSHLIREVLRERATDSVALVLAHRTELIDQAREKYLAVDPEESVGVFQGERNEAWARVICASVQSCYPDKVGPDGEVTRKGRSRDLPLSRVAVVVIDECHHAVAPTYLRLLEEVLAANPAALVLGVSATPYRTDGSGLGLLWNCTLEQLQAGTVKEPTGAVAHRMGIAEGIEGGWLVPFADTSRRVLLDVDLSTVSISRATNDYVEKSLAEVMNTEGVLREMVARWKQHAGCGAPGAPIGGRQTAAFCAGVSMAENLAAAFNAADVPAAWLSGKTHKRERRQIIRRFQAGEIRVLCNCQVLTEGWDAPPTSCIMVGRPTRSQTMFVQMVGRGLRILGPDLGASRSIVTGKSDFFKANLALSVKR